jgi:hypothetical protein
VPTHAKCPCRVQEMSGCGGGIGGGSCDGVEEDVEMAVSQRHGQDPSLTPLASPPRFSANANLSEHTFRAL